MIKPDDVPRRKNFFIFALLSILLFMGIQKFIEAFNIYNNSLDSAHEELVQTKTDLSLRHKRIELENKRKAYISEKRKDWISASNIGKFESLIGYESLQSLRSIAEASWREAAKNRYLVLVRAYNPDNNRHCFGTAHQDPRTAEERKKSGVLRIAECLPTEDRLAFEGHFSDKNKNMPNSQLLGVDESILGNYGFASFGSLSLKNGSVECAKGTPGSYSSNCLTNNSVRAAGNSFANDLANPNLGSVVEFSRSKRLKPELSGVALYKVFLNVADYSIDSDKQRLVVRNQARINFPGRAVISTDNEGGDTREWERIALNIRELYGTGGSYKTTHAYIPDYLSFKKYSVKSESVPNQYQPNINNELKGEYVCGLTRAYKDLSRITPKDINATFVKSLVCVFPVVDGKQFWYVFDFLFDEGLIDFSKGELKSVDSLSSLEKESVTNAVKKYKVDLKWYNKKENLSYFSLFVLLVVIVLSIRFQPSARIRIKREALSMPYNDEGNSQYDASLSNNESKVSRLGLFFKFFYWNSGFEVSRVSEESFNKQKQLTSDGAITYQTDPSIRARAIYVIYEYKQVNVSIFSGELVLFTFTHVNNQTAVEAVYLMKDHVECKAVKGAERWEVLKGNKLIDFSVSQNCVSKDFCAVEGSDGEDAYGMGDMLEETKNLKQAREWMDLTKKARFRFVNGFGLIRCVHDHGKAKKVRSVIHVEYLSTICYLIKQNALEEKHKELIRNWLSPSYSLSRILVCESLEHFEQFIFNYGDLEIISNLKTKIGESFFVAKTFKNDSYRNFREWDFCIVESDNGDFVVVTDKIYVKKKTTHKKPYFLNLNSESDFEENEVHLNLNELPSMYGYVTTRKPDLAFHRWLFEELKLTGKIPDDQISKVFDKYGKGRVKKKKVLKQRKTDKVCGETKL